MIRVFRSGKGTCTGTAFKDGIAESRITKTGQGKFLETEYSGLKEAEEYCRQELRRNRKDIFYLLSGDLIAKTVFDRAFHEEAHTRYRWVYGISSWLFFSLVGLGMSVEIFQNHSISAHLVFTFCVGAFYLIILLVMGAGSFDGAVVMAMLLILLALAQPILKKVTDRAIQSIERRFFIDH